MSLKQPIVAYTANGNLEAHSIVMWLESNGIPAYAVEDNSGVSSFAFGTLSQFHKPKVFVDQTDLERARELLRCFEEQRQERWQSLADAPAIEAECEECGAKSEFPALQNGTTQSCPQCYAFMDVGEFDWPEDTDFGASEEDSQGIADNAEDAIGAAAKLEWDGDWDEAVAAYRQVAERWPEHATYIQNCIAAVERKRDAAL